jgi:TolB-like protein/class 3 adenylate cyclase/Flp pilus assembly protein TadD
MTGSRRLAAILAADVVGYSRLMGEDEAGTARAVREHREAATPIVRSHGGRIVKTMGDGVLLEFPSVVAAVECAIAIPKLMVERNAGVPEDKRIVYRMGVHIGDVIVEGEDILGDGVNIAARLEGIAEPGGICLSASAHEHVQGRVVAHFIDLGEKSLKNITRPVRVYRLGEGVSSAVAETPKPILALPDKPSIAVLPFQNMSGDPEQEYFADGMVEDIITGLARIRWLFVIARNSSFAFKNKSIDARSVGRELGVQYVLDGGVRKAGNRVRITAQLIESETGAHIWADKYDGALEDIFELQDRITDQVVGIVEPSIRQTEIERSRRKRPESLDAYDLCLRASPYQRLATLDEVEKAEPLLTKALALDPSYAPAHNLIGWCHFRRFQFGHGLKHKSAALTHARNAVLAGSDDADVLARAAPLILWLGDIEEAVSAVHRALILNTSSGYAHFFGALVYAFAGQSAKAVDLADRATRLSPFDRLAFVAYEARAIAAFSDARYDEAAFWLDKELLVNPNFIPPRFFKAGALALAGRIDEAKTIVQQALTTTPNFKFRAAMFGMASTIADRFEEAERLLGLREE